MDRKKLLRRLAYLVFFIFIFNFLAGRFYWYTSIWYFDMPMHFLGGLWLGLAFTWLFWSAPRDAKLLLKIMLAVLLIGIFWELFELFFDNYVGQMPFNTLDTLSDLCFDLAGGLTALLYISNKIMPALENRV